MFRESARCCSCSISLSQSGLRSRRFVMFRESARCCSCSISLSQSGTQVQEVCDV